MKVYLKAFLVATSSGSVQHPVIMRLKNKSKGCHQVHSFSKSSSSKAKFGGTLVHGSVEKQAELSVMSIWLTM
jgi:hypothetical protein